MVIVVPCAVQTPVDIKFVGVPQPKPMNGFSPYFQDMFTQRGCRAGPVFTKILIFRIFIRIVIFVRKILRIRIFIFTKILILRITLILRIFLRMVFTPQPLRAVGVLFSLMVSRWAGGGGKSLSGLYLRNCKV